MKLQVGSILTLSAMVGACRSTHPIREESGNGKVKIERTNITSPTDWKVYRLEDVWTSTKSEDQAVKDVLKDDKDLPAPIAANTIAANEPNSEISVPRGEYGDVYLLHVKEGTAGTTFRNSVTFLDDRYPASGGGVHVSLLFVPHLDAAITSTQFSLYPARLWAKDSQGGRSVAALVDGASIDAGIAGPSVIGDAPKEIAGRLAFTFGGGYTFDEGWAVKVGTLVYRNAIQDDKLQNSFYIGLSYDLLSGLVSKKSK